MTNNKVRISELDALRGFAALAVVLYHYTTRYNELFGYNSPYPLTLKWGSYGVQLFFIISGFVIYMTLINSNNIKTFIKKRALRLYPAYVFAVILTFTMVLLFHLPGREVSFKHALINLTMLQGFIPGVDSVDGVYWTLQVELIFYGIMGIIFLSKLHKRIVPLSLIWLSVAFLMRTIGFYYNNGYINLLKQYTINDYCNLFIAGIIFYQLNKEKRKSYYLILLFCLIYQYYCGGMISSLITMTFFILFLLTINKKLPFLKNKILGFLGTISYSLYLVHQNIGYIIINLLRKNNLTKEVYLIIPITISLSLAYLITFHIEAPLRGRVQNKLLRSSVLGSKLTD